MSRTEFLEKLREALDQNVSPHVVRENVEYYGRYINEEMRKGRSEQEILEELGDHNIKRCTSGEKKSQASVSHCILLQLDHSRFGTQTFALVKSSWEFYRLTRALKRTIPKMEPALM